MIEYVTHNSTYQVVQRATSFHIRRFAPTQSDWHEVAWVSEVNGCLATGDSRESTGHELARMVTSTIQFVRAGIDNPPEWQLKNFDSDPDAPELANWEVEFLAGSLASTLLGFGFDLGKLTGSLESLANVDPEVNRLVSVIRQGLEQGVDEPGPTMCEGGC